MIKIQNATDSNLEAIVNIHKAAFPDFFLTSLGDRFLYLYYKCMCQSEEAVTLCAVDDDKVVGFSTTALRSAGFNTRLIKCNIKGYMIEGLRLLFFKPNSLIRLIKNFSKKSEEIMDNGDYAELFSIGVLPTCQGKGVGGLLLADTERVVHEWGG